MISLPRIFKRRSGPQADAYVLPQAEELVVDVAPAAPPPPPAAEPGPEPPPIDTATAAPAVEEAPETPPEPEVSEAEQELRYAQVQAAAIMDDARAEAEAFRQEARAALETELKQLREQGKKEGYDAGYADGLKKAREEGRRKQEKLAQEQIREVERFLEQAAREKNLMLTNAREELKDLAMAIAEKVIRISLKNSSDILLRMADAATDTHKRCEWVHIYVADCDLNGKAFTAPELAAALGHLSNRVRVIPMADDESGTCIVELPDAIMDASVSTQLESIREVLEGITPEPD